MNTNEKRLDSLKKALTLDIPPEYKEAIFRQGFISGIIEVMGAELILFGGLDVNEAKLELNDIFMAVPEYEEMMIVAAEMHYNNLLARIKKEVKDESGAEQDRS